MSPDSVTSLGDRQPEGDVPSLSPGTRHQGVHSSHTSKKPLTPAPGWILVGLNHKEEGGKAHSFWEKGYQDHIYTHQNVEGKK